MQNTVIPPKQLGAILRRIRRIANLSQSELGKKTSLWQETISRIESGTPGTKLDTIFDILAALDLEIAIMPRGKSKPSDLEDLF